MVFVNSAFNPTVRVKNNGQILWEDHAGNIFFSFSRSITARIVLVESVSSYFNPVLQPEATFEAVFPSQVLVPKVFIPELFRLTSAITILLMIPSAVLFNVILRVNTGDPMLLVIAI